MNAVDSLRLEQRHAFLNRLNVDSRQVVFLAKDMSPRQYFRVLNKPYVLMDVPPPDTIHNYVKVANILHTQGLRAPKIYEWDENHGFALIEDFGDQTFANILQKDKAQTFKLYDLAIDVIRHLERNLNDKPESIQDYSIEKLMAETNLFVEWYWLYVFKEKPTELIRKEFYEIFFKYYQNLPPTPSTLVLRDYHLDNLMYLNGESTKKCGLLDFQDAQWGSVIYDYISLVEDARYDVDEPIAQYCWEKMTKELTSEERNNYFYTACVLGLGRHLKVLGVFTRYAVLYNNPSKLVHIDRLWRYVLKTCEHAEFYELKIWLQSYFSKSFQSKMSEL